MSIEVTSKADEHLDSLISDGIRNFNSEFSSGTVEHLRVYEKNEDNIFVGGLTAATYGNWLHIDLLWVNASERGNGIGSGLLSAAEEEATKRGCIGSTLDTYSFQALGFYLKHGYNQFGQLDGYAGKYIRHYLQKSLKTEQ